MTAHPYLTPRTLDELCEEVEAEETLARWARDEDAERGRRAWARLRWLTRLSVVVAAVVAGLALVMLLGGCGGGDTVAGCADQLRAQWAVNLAGDPSDAELDAQTQDTFEQCDELSAAQYAQAGNAVIGGLA